MVSVLGTAVAALRGLDVAGLADGSLSALLCGLEEFRNVVDAVQADVAHRWDARTVWAGDGARSGAGWLASHTTASRPAAASMIRVGRALTSMPLVAAAFEAGEVGVAQVRLLVSARADAPDVFARHEELLVDEARRLRVDELARVLEFWRSHANPDGAEDREAKRFASRGVSLTRGFDGMWDLKGRLTNEAGETLRDVLDRISKHLYDADVALAAANPELPMRSGAQRCHDALHEHARQHLSAGPDGTAMRTPSVTVVVNAETFADEHANGTDPVGETAHGAPVTKTAAERLTCDCHVARVVMGPGSVPVDLSTTARLPSPAQRRALFVRYRGCAFPGCDQPPGWTSAHHIQHWAHGGPTNLDNLVPLCTYHHHCVHEGGYGVARAPSGALRFTKPDGTPLTVPKHRAPDPTHGPPGQPRAA